jgi:hypothetical protein
LRRFEFRRAGCSARSPQTRPDCAGSLPAARRGDAELLIQEQSLGIHYNIDSDLLDYLVDRSVFVAETGHVRRPTGPGLGIEVDEAEVRRVAADPHRWRNVIWRHNDGSLAAW